MKKLLMLSTLLLAAMSSSIAQRTISGTVTDQEGEVLIGANILIQGTNRGTITDADGMFELTVTEDDEYFEVSYVSFETKRVQITGQDFYPVVLNQGKILEEVVVIGYGEQEKESLTGAVTTVSAREFENKPIATVDQLLQGQAPGLIVLGGTGQPGADAGSVILRGPSTIQGDNSPIYIMDGIQISEDDFAALNPNDVESVSVLRDASSAAIYGASGANGVILITTKMGKPGATRVDYNFQYGVASRTQDRFEMMNATEKLAFEELAQRGPGWILSPNNPANAGLSEDQLMENAAALDSLRNINTNWRDLIFQTGKVQQHNLRVSGGDENSTFYFSGNYYLEEGQMIDSRFERGTIRMNLEENVSSKFTLGIRATGGYGQQRFIQSEGAVNLNNPFALAYLMNPYETIRDADGDYYFGATGRNPFEEAELNESSTTDLKGIANMYAIFDITDEISLRGRWGVDHTNSSFTEYIDPDSRLGSTTVQGNQGELDRERESTTWITLSHIAEYKKILNERHNLNIIVGQEFRKRYLDNFEFEGFGLSGGLISPAGITPGSEDSPDFIPVVDGFIREKSLLSFLSRVNYTLDDKYNLTAGVRRDGSSVFGDNNRWGNFWNVGASWIISREDFMVNSDVINHLKLSVGYGTVGNSEGIGEREKYALFTNGSYAGNSAFLPSATNPGNPDLKWEVLRGFNAGLLFGLFDDYLVAEVNYYYNVTDDLFISQELPRSAGGTSLTINAGTMKNEGVEVAMDLNLLRGEFNLAVGGQFSYNKNVITDLGQVDEFEQGTAIIREGLPLGTHYIEEWGGVNPVNGNPLYVDDEGNLTENFNAVDPKATFGTYYAPWAGGVTLDASYKGFNLSVLGSWAYGNTLFNNQTFFQENPNFAQFNLSTIMNTVWQEEGDITEIQRIGTPRQFSSKDLEDGSFFRLRNVTLGYNVPLNSPLLNAIDRINIFVQAKNLLTITDFTGFDPEIDNNIAQYEYPGSRAFTFGLNLTL